MNTVEQLTLSSREIVFYKFVLSFYPEPYRRYFGEQMLLVFEDSYQEEVTKNGRVRASFWFAQIADLTQSVFQQHKEYFGEFGFKKYLSEVVHLNALNVIGIFLLMPFVSVFAIDAFSRLFQGDLLHPNNVVLHGLYNTPFYWAPILFTWVFLFPILAIGLSVISLIKSLIKKYRSGDFHGFLPATSLSLLILCAGLSAVAFIFLHDVAGCLANGLWREGLGQVLRLVGYCRRVA